MQKPPLKAQSPGRASLQLRRLLRGAPRVKLDGRGTYRSRLHLEGTFKPGWLGSLAASVASHGISILEGSAECDPLGSWTADLVLERSPTGTMPADLDFVALADEEAAEYGGPRVDLSIALVSRVPDHGGSLLLCVEGRDQVGFLATLLTRLAKVALFPVELRIATTSGRVSDRLWLRCPGNRAPDADALSVVTQALRPILRTS